mmetsp:Transcript_9119/g.22476  ORF Transcript_9119/g.22476 Transcript_9119/m.22476 type:complete len:388 (+) Transcript_9119:189-1352(+)
MGSKLLSYYQVHPPDLKKRAYYQSLGLRTSDADVGDAVSTGKMLNTPPPPRSSIFTTDTRQKKGPSMTHEDDYGAAASQSTVSLVAPLLWVPGVLRAQGPWATVMKETLAGPTYAMPGVDLMKEDSELPLGKKTENVAEQMLLKDRLISELERSLSKQKKLNDKALGETRKHADSVLEQMEDARKLDKKRTEAEVLGRVKPLQEQLASLKEDLSTTKKANRVRVKRAYAQDNFLSSYAKGMSHIKDMAKEMAAKSSRKLKQDLDVVERRLTRDAVYKKALKMRTETAEVAAERRYTEAENKIPVLQREVLMSSLAREQTERMFADRINRSKRELDQVSGIAKQDAAEKHKLAIENGRLKARVDELDYKFRTAEKALARLRLKELGTP